MHVKRLYRPTVREALAAAREELGPGALVLSTELVPAPGWRGWAGHRVVRLTAAANRPEDAALDVESADGVSASRRSRPARRHVEASGPYAGILARLQAIGLDPEFSASVAARLSPAECRGGAEDALRRAIAAELAALCTDDIGHGRCEVFVGPPGVGKTTTIAKIAAQDCAAGHHSVGLVAADAFRAGAVEQLRSYADVMSVPLRLARGVTDLEEALDGLRRTALVDTAGRPPSDASMVGLFDVLSRRPGVRTHLVLAADTSRATANRILDRYAQVKPSRVVITKLDEAESVMPLLAAIRDRGLPVSYLAAGQRVPEDLWRATPVGLASVLLDEPSTEEITCH
jgi:flagellar biosynthesis protein FlhF